MYTVSISTPTPIVNLSVILCTDSEGGIGKNNKLFCESKHDLKWFKERTLNKIVILGTNTLESIRNYNKGGILPNRFHIVLSRYKNNCTNEENIRYYSDYKSILKLVEANKHLEFVVIGGAMIYDLFLPYASKLYLTQIEGNFYCDAFIDLRLFNMSKRKAVILKFATPKSSNCKFTIHRILI